MGVTFLNYCVRKCAVSTCKSLFIKQSTRTIKSKTSCFLPNVWWKWAQGCFHLAWDVFDISCLSACTQLVTFPAVSTNSELWCIFVLTLFPPCFSFWKTNSDLNLLLYWYASVISPGIVREMAHKSDSKLKSISTTRLTAQHHLWYDSDSNSRCSDKMAAIFVLFVYTPKDVVWIVFVLICTRSGGVSC